MDSDVIEGHRNEYQRDYDNALNRYVREFTIEFCDENGVVDWEKLVRFNSGAD